MATDAGSPVRLGSMVILVLIGLLCLLPGLMTIPPVDRDEARFAQATRQMLQSGDYITPRLGEETRFKKPIGIYWLQAGVAKVTGYGGDAPIGIYRIPSLLAALLSILLVYGMGARLFGERAGLLAALLLLVSPVFGVEARLAKTDAAQLLAALVAQYALMRAYMAEPGARPPGVALAFWAAMGAGIMLKGPIVPMLSALTIAMLVVWDRKADWLRALRPLAGIPLMLLIVLPWLVAILIQSGGDFFRESVGNDLLGKVAAGQESHGRPPGLHLLTAFIGYWPGAFLVLAATPWIWRHRQDVAVRFCLAWLIPFWVAFELIVTKLPHYTLPAVPAAFLLAAAAFSVSMGELTQGWRRTVIVCASLVGAVLAVGLGIAFRFYQAEYPPLPALLAGLAVICLAAAVIRNIVLHKAGLALGLLIAQAGLVLVCLFGLLLPHAQRFWIAPRAAVALAQYAPCANPAVLSAGMGEASMLFAFGSGLRFGDGAAAADFFNADGCRAVLVSAAEMPAFQARRTETAAPSLPAPIEVEGFNLGSGKKVNLTIFASSVKP